MTATRSPKPKRLSRRWRVVLITTGALAVLGAGTYACRGALMRAILEPAQPFAQTAAPPPPDYAAPAAWAALPDRQDGADVTPQGETDQQSAALADAFFVHPTTYLRGAGWNAALADEELNERTDRLVMRSQASVFNGCCRVYAPRYRQAVLYSFMAAGEDGNRARDLAYGDVLAAFDHYLRHYSSGRPIVIAGHSQGAYHALRLLEERFASGKLRRRLVVAYLIGAAVPKDKITRTLGGLPLCYSADQTSCLVTYNTVGEAASPERIGKVRVFYPKGYEQNGDKTILCVNPLSWLADGSPADRSLSLGGVRFSGDDDSPPVAAGLVAAQCTGGLLQISEPEKREFRRLLLGGDDYHIYDYSLFYLNLRRNAVQRVTSHLAKAR